MRFIQTMSYKGANYLMKQRQENHEKRRVYYYGFQIVIGGMVKLILLTLLALITQTLKASIIIVLIFSSLRMLAGGYHMDSYGKCIGVWWSCNCRNDIYLYISILVYIFNHCFNRYYLPHFYYKHYKMGTFR